MSNEADEYVASAMRDNWGFSGGLVTGGPAAGGGFGAPSAVTLLQPLVSVRLPVWMSQRWTITLLQMKLVGGSQLVPWDPAVQGPVANDYVDSQNQTVQGATNNGQPFQLSLQWGQGGVTEFATLDYPYAGGTLSFCASQFQLSLAAMDQATLDVLAASGVAPRLGAFVARGGVAKELGAGPLYTTQIINQRSNTGNQFLVPVPPRARAYRLLWNGQTGDPSYSSSGSTFTVLQQAGTIGGNLPFQLCVDMVGDQDFEQGESFYSLQEIGPATLDGIAAAGIWARALKNNVGILHPGCAQLSVQVDNQEGEELTVSYAIQFALDLG